MAFEYTNKKGQKYYLYQKDVQLRGSGKVQRIYFFKRESGAGVLNEVPSGYSVMEIERTGLPVLKKK